MELVDEKALVRRLFQAINANDKEAAAGVLSPNHVFTDGFSRILGHGASGVHSLVYDRQLKVPDLRYEVEELICEPGVVAATWVASGTPLGGSSEVHVRGMSRHRIRNGRIAESLLTFNPLGVLPKMRL